MPKGVPRAIIDHMVPLITTDKELPKEEIGKFSKVKLIRHYFSILEVFETDS